MSLATLSAVMATLILPERNFSLYVVSCHGFISGHPKFALCCHHFFLLLFNLFSAPARRKLENTLLDLGSQLWAEIAHFGRRPKQALLPALWPKWGLHEPKLKSTAVNSTPIRHPKTAERKKHQRFLGSKVAILWFPRTTGLLNQKFSVKRYRICFRTIQPNVSNVALSTCHDFCPWRWP